MPAAMVSRLLLVLVPLWSLVLFCRAEEASREESVSWFMERVLESLGLEGPLAGAPGGPGGAIPARPAPPAPPRTTKSTQVDHQTLTSKDTSEMILFPGPDSGCVGSGWPPGENTSNHFSYHFRPSVKSQDTVVTSAHFWFYAGEGVNSSAPLFLVAPDQRLVQVAEGPWRTSSDGWVTYIVGQKLLTFMAEGPFLLQVRCPPCHCGTHEADKTPFLHLHARPRGPARSRRSPPVSIPWSPSAVDLLQRPSQERPLQSDCHRAEVEVSFQELGWDNWIVHPKVLTFYYCHGNCSAGDRTTAALGITQCCAPVPGTMRSLRITTTSDSGYSFKYETLPNIIPEECSCV